MKAEQKGVSSRYILVGLRKNLREKAEPQSDVGKVSRFCREIVESQMEKLGGKSA